MRKNGFLGFIYNIQKKLRQKYGNSNWKIQEARYLLGRV